VWALAAKSSGETVWALAAKSSGERDSCTRSRAHEEGTLLASVCTGGILLAHAGVLDDRPATTHASALEDLREFADVRDARVVDTGDVLSAGGVTSGLDLAFHVVRREFGEDVAERVAQEMEYQSSDDVLVV
jgi:transcriptional regulator GlxA family with amidase domain